MKKNRENTVWMCWAVNIACGIYRQLIAFQQLLGPCDFRFIVGQAAFLDIERRDNNGYDIQDNDATRFIYII